MGVSKDRIVDFCDKIIETFIYVLIFSLPFSPALIEISATFMIFAWLTKRALGYRPFKPVSTYLNIPIIIFILATFLSVIFSSNFSLSLKNFGSKTLEYIFLFFIAAEFVCDKRRLKNIVIVMLSSAAMVGVDCIFQYFLGFDFLRHRAMEAGRITGSFKMPGDLAGYLAPVLCLPLALCFLKFKKGIQYFLRIESILLLAVLIVTVARGAWVGFIAAVCFLGWVENKKIFWVTGVSSLVLIILMPHLTGPGGDILGRLKSIILLSDGSALDRKAIWQVALRMIRDKPLFGQGLSTFMGNFARFGKDYYYLKESIIPYAHNCYLQIAAETGIIGLVSFLLLIGTFFISTIKNLAKIKDRFYHAVLSAVSAGIIVTLVHSLVDTNLYSLQLSVLFWIMLGINAAIIRNKTP
jgi:O-antigen ligase